MTLIQIHRRHLSPHATEADALAFVEALGGQGWPVVYTTADKPLWRFDDGDQMCIFERDFDELHEKFVPPFVWSVAFDASEDPAWGIEGYLEDQAQHVPHVEYGERGKGEQSCD